MQLIFQKVLDMGYAGGQMGTRFLATHECKITDAYKQTIVDSTEDDIVWTNKIAGNNSSVIKTDDIMKGGLRTGPIISYMLTNQSQQTCLLCLQQNWQDWLRIR